MNVRKAMCTLEGNNIERPKVAVGVVMIICRLRPAGGLSVTCNLLKTVLLTLPPPQFMDQPL